MKKLIFLWAALASTSLAEAQNISERQVPAIVKSSLHKSYPNATALKWEKEDGNYEVEFMVAETSYSVLMGATGNILETEVGIGTDVLPAAAKAYISQSYPGKEIKEAAKITDSKSTVTYEAEVNGRDLMFDHMGKFLKAVKD